MSRDQLSKKRSMIARPGQAIALITTLALCFASGCGDDEGESTTGTTAATSTGTDGASSTGSAGTDSTSAEMSGTSGQTTSTSTSTSATTVGSGTTDDPSACGAPGSNSYEKDGTCYCADGYNWCTMDDPSDFTCCELDTGTGDTSRCGENSYEGEDGLCYCDEGYDWCDDIGIDCCPDGTTSG